MKLKKILFVFVILFYAGFTTLLFSNPKGSEKTEKIAENFYYKNDLQIVKNLTEKYFVSNLSSWIYTFYCDFSRNSDYQTGKTLVDLDNAGKEYELETATITVSEIINSPFTNLIPTLDGYYNASEWSDAAAVDITLDGYDNVTAYFKNTDTKLYIAITDNNMNDISAQPGMGFYFDDDHNGLWDAEMPSGEGNFWITDWNEDAGTEITFRGIYGTNPDYEDVIFDPEGVVAQISDNGSFIAFELEIDLTTSLCQGNPEDTIGLYMWSVRYDNNIFPGKFPDDLGGNWSNPAYYGDLILGNQVVAPIVTAVANPGCGTGSVTVISNTPGTQTFYLKDNNGNLINEYTGNTTSHEFTNLDNGFYIGQVYNNGFMSELSNTVNLINFDNPVSPTFVSASENNICNNASTILYYNGGSGTDFVWYAGSCDGEQIGTGNNLTVSPDITTIYYGRWENACGNSDCESVTVTVDELIEANAGDNDEICETYYILNGNNPEQGTGIWQLTSGSAVISNPSLYNTTITELISNQNATLSWTITNGECESADYVTITVSELAVAPIFVSAGENNICNNTSTILSYNGGSGTDFVWYAGSCGGTKIGTGNNLTVSPDITTTYYGRWENACGNSDCESVTVTVDELIEANAGDNDEICETYYILNGNNPEQGTGIWQLTSGSAVISNPSLYNTTITELISNQNATLSWTITNGECESADYVTITVFETTNISSQPEDVTAFYGEDISFTVVAEGENINYQWRFNGNNIALANESTYYLNNITFDNEGNYDLVISGECGNQTSNIAELIVEPNSVDEFAEYGIKIYPNPAKDIFNISMNNKFENAKITISDITGRIIYNKLIGNSKFHTINLSGKAKGIYFIYLNLYEKIIVTKLIIE